MSRQIIFRGKTLFENKIVCGYLTSLCEIRVFITDEWEGQYEAFNVDPGTVGQYTGLKDKNGVEVYEGDVIKIDGSEKILFVIFKNGCFYSRNNEVGTNYRLGGWESGSFDIIGNIHQNPELLNNK